MKLNQQELKQSYLDATATDDVVLNKLLNVGFIFIKKSQPLVGYSIHNEFVVDGEIYLLAKHSTDDLEDVPNFL